MLAAAGCPVVAERDAEREVRPQDLLQGPNVSALPEQRAALDALVQSLEREGGAGLRRRGGGVAGEVRLVRTDAVLLGIKSEAWRLEDGVAARLQLVQGGREVGQGL